MEKLTNTIFQGDVSVTYIDSIGEDQCALALPERQTGPANQQALPHTGQRNWDRCVICLPSLPNEGTSQRQVMRFVPGHLFRK